MRELVQDLLDRSPTAHDLIDRLEHSDVVVYIRFRLFAAPDLDGRVALLSAVPGRRYLVIELACLRNRPAAMSMLAHELHHAVEIAEAPDVVDARTLARYFGRIGCRTQLAPNSEIFETFAARDTAAQVRRELIGSVVRTTVVRTTNERD